MLKLPVFKLKLPSLKISTRLSGSPAWMVVAAFGTYFCMYGFRKPYTAATYASTGVLGAEYKFLLILAQTTGYVIAKWAGIKIVAEIKPAQRIKAILLLIFFAELMLLLFGMVPRPWNALLLFCNGLPLGIVFGLVLGFLEGRRHTEALIAGLCASFIVSDGVSKSVGSWLLNIGVAENWMPVLAGLVFLVPLLVFCAMLSAVPPPSAADVATRSQRVPMLKTARLAFFKKYAPALTVIVLVYLFATILRSIRADFAPELWLSLGYKQTPALFTQSELVVSFFVIIVNGLSIFIANHYKALQTSLFTCLVGLLLLLLAVTGLHYGLDSFSFMVLAGLGIYIPYVAVHTTIFERLVALTKERANIGFLMYVADSAGYTGYILIMLFKYIAPPAAHGVLGLFLTLAVVLSFAGIVLLIFCYRYFTQKFKHHA
jgi:hypothetical protein